MDKNILRNLIREEIKKTLNENDSKYKTGDHFKYMGTDHEVLDDNGFIVTARTSKGNVVKLNHNQINKQDVNENEEVDKMTMKRGIKNVTSRILSSLDSLDIETLQKLSSAINKAEDIISPRNISAFQGDPRNIEF